MCVYQSSSRSLFKKGGASSWNLAQEITMSMDIWPTNPCSVIISLVLFSAEVLVPKAVFNNRGTQ